MSGNVFDTIDQTFAAGEDKTFYFNGAYFELVTCPFPVTVEFMSREGSVLGTWRNAEQGAYARGEFAWLRIKSAQAQTIKAYYGPNEVGTRRSSGSVTLAAAAELDAATIAALVRPELRTGTYNTIAALAANTAETIVAAATNTNGLIVHMCEANGGNASAIFMAFLSKAGAAPTSVTDGEALAISRQTAANASFVATGINMHKDIYVPPNHGFYFIQNGAMASHRQARWKLL